MPVQGNKYSTNFASLRGEIRRLIQNGLCEITKKDDIKMAWTADTFFRKVVQAEKVWLRGWPKSYPFTNFSVWSGGSSALREFHQRLVRKELVWEHVPADVLPTLDVISAAPSWIPKHLRRVGRSDIGKTREHRGKRRRYPRNGAKTPSIVDSTLDSDIEEYSDDGREVVIGQKRKRACYYKSAEIVEDSDEEGMELGCRSEAVDEIEEFSE
ncbi:hypothetical protein DAEQUDRAFT_770877 [Daedalea quercina L-15889]|uniref:Uncharacterized protein n=1 Tax=Daedalea quercina L-15889 TaxID=1314783 RepID=A0A165KHJ7_9APHY|nr:hypothetical protein DAEQUDRAFT_770877 [Daedalea quercina L-15889]